MVFASLLSQVSVITTAGWLPCYCCDPVLCRIIAANYSELWGQDSVVATGWTVRGSNPVSDEIFRTRPDRSWGPPILLRNGYLVSFLAVKWPGRGVYRRLSTNAEVKERVVLYLRPWASVACYGVTFTFVIIGRHEEEKKSRKEIGAYGDTWRRRTRKKRK